MNHLVLVIVVILCLSGLSRPAVAEPELEQKPIFVRGVGGYNIYRIPSLLVTPNGTLLAFCEGREGGDSSDIDMLVRRSKDCGTNWSRKHVVWDEGKNVCGNPCPVVDEDTGTIWLLMNWNDSSDSNNQLHTGTGKSSRRVFISRSEDDGDSWSEPEDITENVKRDNWSWYAVGPGVGIQLHSGPQKGRLVIPCDYTDENGFGSHVIYSDDHGETWHIGGTVSGGANECQVVQLSDGTLMLNMRMQANGEGKRGVAFSEDGGETFSALQLDPNLIEPVCQGSIIRYDDMLLFSNPASSTPPGKRNGPRVKMTIRASYDEGKSWPVSRLLHEGFSAYSCLAELPDRRIGCLYEGGEEPYGEIVFARFNLEWLTSTNE